MASDTVFPNSWQISGDFGNDTMSYTIALGGANFSNVIPEPSSLSLLGLGGLLLMGRRRG